MEVQVEEESQEVWWGLPDLGEEQELKSSLMPTLHRELNQVL